MPDTHTCENHDIHIGWKVLTRGRESIMMYGSTAGLYYPLEKWVQRKTENGPLAVFDTKRNAVCFSENIPGKIIVMCEYKSFNGPEQTLWFRNAYSNPDYINITVAGPEQDLYILKENPNTGAVIHEYIQRSSLKNRLPHGTKFAEAVKCLE